MAEQAIRACVINYLDGRHCIQGRRELQGYQQDHVPCRRIA